jgi:hypothetical protein
MIYVDDMRMPARVGRIEAQWSHLFAGPWDDLAELHQFAALIGLQRRWFQDKPWPKQHYDVTDSKRDLAIANGAVPVTSAAGGRMRRDARQRGRDNPPPLAAGPAVAIDWSQLVVETGDELFDPPEAVFDKARLYRYRLTRTWGDGPTLVVVMLNPSTADAFRNDPTITRVIDFAKREGYGGIVVVNLFAWRATKPAELRRPGIAPVGVFNDAFILQECTQPDRAVLAAWGANGTLNGRAAAVVAALGQAGKPLVCLGLTKDGHPSHPLYLLADAPLIPYAPLAATG